MDITDIRIRRVESEGKLKAYVTLTFDECFVVHNLKIISGQAGTFVAMPSRKTKKGEYKDIAHPINSDFRKVIQERILNEYSQMEDETEFSNQDETSTDVKSSGDTETSAESAAESEVSDRPTGESTETL